MIRLNGLPYNANRDPETYRRRVGLPFRIEAVLQGSGEADGTLRDAAGNELGRATTRLPGSLSFSVAFPTPGSRIVTLSVIAGEQRFEQDLRLDVEPPAHA